MSKRAYHNRKPSSSRPLPWRWLGLVGVLLLVGGVAVWFWTSRSAAVIPQVTGAPKLAVDQVTVDEGYVKFNVPVRTAFRLSNVGDQPLEIRGAPVELIEGC